VVGHTPHGNCPSVIKCGGPGRTQPCMQIIMADTSYSNMKAADNRGDAVSEVLLLPDGEVRVHGRLEDGTPLDYTLGVGVGPADELVGHIEAEGGEAEGKPPQRFVKAWLPTGKGIYLLCHVDGFRYTYERLPAPDFESVIEAEAKTADSPSDMHSPAFWHRSPTHSIREKIEPALRQIEQLRMCTLTTKLIDDLRNTVGSEKNTAEGPGEEHEVGNYCSIRIT